MQSFDTVLKRGRTVWDRQLLPESIFEQRFALVSDKMETLNLDVIFVYGDVRSHGCLAWLTNYLPRVRDAFLVWKRNDAGKGKLFINMGSRDIPFANSLSFQDDVVSFDKLEPYGVEYFNDLIQKKARFGFVNVNQNIPQGLWERLFLNTDSPVNYVDLTSWFNELRFDKSEHEGQLVRQAADIASKAFEQLYQVDLELTDQGTILQSELIAELEFYCRCQGAEDVRILIASGKGENSSFTSGKGSIQIGETIAISLSLQCHRYCAEIGRTLKVCGSKVEPMRGLHAKEKVDDLFKELHNVRDGVLLKQMYDQWNNDMNGDISIFPVCEGIGIDFYEFIPEITHVNLATFVVRWGARTSDGLQYWADTVEWGSRSTAILTK